MDEFQDEICLTCSNKGDCDDNYKCKEGYCTIDGKLKIIWILIITYHCLIICGYVRDYDDEYQTSLKQPINNEYKYCVEIQNAMIMMIVQEINVVGYKNVVMIKLILL